MSRELARDRGGAWSYRIVPWVHGVLLLAGRPMTAAKQRGTAAETAVVNYARSLGYDAERIPLAGGRDEGDVVIRRPGGLLTVCEVKAVKTVTLADFVDQAIAERDAYCAKRGLDPATVEAVAVVKRRGKGIAQAYVVSELREHLR